MHERDWNRDWDLAIDPSAPDTEKYDELRVALRYWLKRMRELEEENEGLKAIIEHDKLVLELKEANELERRVRELERQVKLLTNALEEIVRYTPELIQIPEDLVHAVETCPDCQRAREAKWPPSGLCNKHYGEMSNRVWGPQERARRYQHLELRDIARKALEALDKEDK